MAKSVLVYGGKGSLGSVVVDSFKAHGYRVVSVDLAAHPNADSSILVNAKLSLKQQADAVMQELQQMLGESKLNGVICVAGGWAGGNAASEHLVRNTDLMFKQSVWTSIISTSIAAHYLLPKGVIVLTGAVPALGATAGMLGYGMAKAAVHQLTKSLAAPNSGLPEDATAIAILPITLDTPQNREHMKGADTSTWTPLGLVADLLFEWVDGGHPPPSGSLAQLVTKNNETQVVIE